MDTLLQVVIWQSQTTPGTGSGEASCLYSPLATMTLAPDAHTIDPAETSNLMEYKVSLGTHMLLTSSLRRENHLLTTNGAPTIVPRYYHNPGCIAREATEIAVIHATQLAYSTPTPRDSLTALPWMHSRPTARPTAPQPISVEPTPRESRSRTRAHFNASTHAASSRQSLTQHLLLPPRAITSSRLGLSRSLERPHQLNSPTCLAIVGWRALHCHLRTPSHEAHRLYAAGFDHRLRHRGSPLANATCRHPSCSSSIATVTHVLLECASACR